MSIPAELIEKLSQFDLFDDFDPATIQTIAESGRSKTFTSGLNIVQESTLGEDFYVILSGRVSISVRGPSGNPIEVARLKDGDVIGETVLLGKVRRQASVVARDDVKVFAWKEVAMIELLKNNPVIGFKLMRNLARILSDKVTSTNMMFRNHRSQHVA